MVKISIVCVSKNKKSLLVFQQYIKNILQSKKNIKIKYKNSKLKKITILKSPHVHKSAQEIFCFKLLSRKLTAFSCNLEFFLHLIKNLSILAFYDIKINQTFYFFKKMGSYLFSLTNKNSSNKLCINFYFKMRIQTENFINILNYKGLSALCLNSSDGRAKD